MAGLLTHVRPIEGATASGFGSSGTGAGDGSGFSTGIEGGGGSFSGGLIEATFIDDDGSNGPKALDEARAGGWDDVVAVLAHRTLTRLRQEAARQPPLPPEPRRL